MHNLSPFWQAVLDLCRSTTQVVGDRLLQDFAKVQADFKADGSVVTECDRWADAHIVSTIGKAFPDHGVLSEEGAQVLPEKDWCWIIDPLDGTNNFTRGVPVWDISIGLLYRGTPVFGYLSVPPINQAFYGFYGDRTLVPELPENGAWTVDGRQLQPSPDEPSRTHFASFCSRSWILKPADFPLKGRALGAAAFNLVSVATGAVLSSVEASPKIWDIAAAWPILHGAGAVWQPLTSGELFPLKPGVNYRDVPYPTLAVNRSELLPVVLPITEELRATYA
ncbi:MAG: inositol monophosphatase family protein [Cyanobacteria bacterium P01_F01_bin.33]